MSNEIEQKSRHEAFWEVVDAGIIPYNLRLYKAFIRLDIHCLGELRGRSRQEFLSLKNFGAVSLCHLEAMSTYFGIVLKP